jgi:hypothetical protein
MIKTQQGSNKEYVNKKIFKIVEFEKKDFKINESLYVFKLKKSQRRF